MYSSITEHSSDPNKNSFHWRNNSGELGVFEAARYFSNDQINGLNFSQKLIQDVQRPPGRRSLDMPMRSNPTNPDFHHRHHHDHMIMDHQKPMKEVKKFKQPSSPGGRLATFLNSLFNQTHLKKKKSKSGKSDFEDESPGGRRKRRSSISHFRITSNFLTSSDDKKSLSGSGLRTPPVYANTPTKPCQEFRKFPVHEMISSHGRNFKITLLDELHAEKNGRIKNGVSDKTMKNAKLGFSDMKWDPLSDQESEFRTMGTQEDDGADSDSSSDLFDLPNHELDFFSNGLPVYGTTHMDKIKIAESYL